MKYYFLPHTPQNLFFLVGILDLIVTATKDSGIGEKIKALTWKVHSEGVNIIIFISFATMYKQHSSCDDLPYPLYQPVLQCSNFLGRKWYNFSFKLTVIVVM